MMTTLSPPRPARAPATPPAARRELTLKLYVDSTSLSLVQQMADFVACADAPDVIKLITWLRLPLGEAQLKGCGAFYLAQRAAVSAEFVQLVCDSVRRHRFARIELHANQYQAWRGALPLLTALVPLAESLGSRLTLELYDDGTVGLVEREALKALPDPEAALKTAAADLRRGVHQGTAFEWSIAHSYAWQHVLPTRYHLLRRDLLLRDPAGQALHALLDPVSTELGPSAAPIIPKHWQKLNTMTIAFGHGLSVTPLQLATATLPLLNGGIAVQPTFLTRSAEEAMSTSPRVLKPATSAAMLKLMRMNVVKGTGKNADAEGYRVGGKTGTAEKVVKGRYSNSALLTSFLAAFPTDDPQYLVLVMLDEPQRVAATKGYATAGWNAAPTVGKIVARIGPILGVPPKLAAGQSRFDAKVSATY